MKGVGELIDINMVTKKYKPRKKQYTKATVGMPYYLQEVRVNMEPLYYVASLCLELGLDYLLFYVMKKRKELFINLYPRR